MIKAKMKNGLILGEINSKRSSKKHLISFKQISVRKEMNLIHELRRLYFEPYNDVQNANVSGATSNKKLQLLHLEEEGYLSDIGLSHKDFQDEHGISKFDDLKLVCAEMDPDRILYFLAQIKGSESNLINMKLERKGKDVEFSVRMIK
jgi:hypothetical protein